MFGVYLWTFYLIPLIFILHQYHAVLITVALHYSLKLGCLISPAPFFLRLLWLFKVLCVCTQKVNFFILIPLKRSLVI